MSEPIILEKNNAIWTLRVNRPSALNALNFAAQDGFAMAVNEVRDSQSCRVLIITGTGERAFISGGDLKELNEKTAPEYGEKLATVMHGALRMLTRLPIPVIAAVNGSAFGGGCEVLTACDLRVSVPTAKFSFAQVRNAVTTGWGSTQRLVHLLGQSRAMALMLTGMVFSADEAKRMGFVHEVEDELESAVFSLATHLLAQPTDALASLKQLVIAANTASLHEYDALERNLFTSHWQSVNHQEALAAFVEKRKAVFNQSS